MTHQEIVEELLKKQTSDNRKSVIVNNVSILNLHLTDKETEDENGTRVQMSITTDKEFDTYRANAAGEYEPDKSKVIFPSFLGLQSLLRTNEKAMPFVDQIMDNESALKIILGGAKVRVLNIPVEEGELYINLWSTKKNPEPYEVKHNSWYANIVEITLSPRAEQYLDMMALKALGL